MLKYWTPLVLIDGERDYKLLNWKRFKLDLLIEDLVVVSESGLQVSEKR